MINDENTADFGITDLSEALAGPQAIEIASALTTRLDAAKARVAAERAQGLPLGQVQRFEAVARALDASHAIVVRLSSR